MKAMESWAGPGNEATLLLISLLFILCFFLFFFFGRPCKEKTSLSVFIDMPEIVQENIQFSQDSLPVPPNKDAPYTCTKHTGNLSFFSVQYDFA